ncbi:MAG TPA: putative 2OG-Fe(II) oxygenase [Xanthobacteraceae bacterium]|jgi:tetratricopeptide (TPR) repeat protein
MVTWVPRISPPAQAALIEAARQSVSLQRERAAAWITLATLLIKACEFQEACDLLNEGAERFHNEANIHLLLAKARFNVGDLEAALSAAETAFSLQPHDRATVLTRFDLIVEMADWDRVALQLDNVVAIAPQRRSVFAAREHFARARDDYDAVLAACDEALAQQTGDTRVLLRKAQTLMRLGRDAEARAIFGLDDFVSISDLGAGDERVGGDAFLKAVAAEIQRNPTLDSPHNRVTRVALKTGVLLQPGDEAVPLLIEKIKLEVERYIEALPKRSHPFTTVRSERLRLDPWGMVYPGDGRQESHWHPSGWITGVVYVTAPKLEGENEFRGPLVLGELDSERHPHPPPWGTREVEPVPGRIVLFPSFVPHATRSTGIQGPRICVAFDVAPV